MKVSELSTNELNEYAELVIKDIVRISDEWHNRMPALKALLVKIENEIYQRGK